MPHLEPFAKAKLRPVADVGKGHELAAAEAQDERDAKATRDERGEKPGVVRPEGVNEIERPLFFEAPDERPEATQENLPRPARAGREPEVVDARAEKRVVRRRPLLREREDVDVVPPREPLDQPEESGDDVFRPASVDTARNEEGQAHAPC